MASRRGKMRSIEDVIAYEDDKFAFSQSGPRRKQSGADEALVGIIDTLYSEHGYINSLLDNLELQGTRLRPGRIPDYQLILDIVDYLTNYPGQFHHPREDLLFGSLLKRDPKFRKLLERLQREHETLHFHNDRLCRELSRIIDGAPANRPELLRSLEKYVDGYRRHIGYESEQIFPLAHGTLTSRELKALNTRTRHLDDPLFGAKVQFKYRRLQRNLETRISELGSQVVARQFSAIESMIGGLTGIVDTVGQLQQGCAELRHALRGGRDRKSPRIH